MKTELQIPSDLKFLSVVENWLLVTLQAEVGESIDLQKQFRRLRLALVEAFSNVVRHAHRDQPNLPISICLEIKDTDVALQIWDYGKGFDLSTYLPPNPDVPQENGYGWLIMTRLMDRVEYRLQDTVDGRNCLRLETHLPKEQKTP
ncbi:ATP-binding protein [Lyngbya aestuarii]|uniref:ATP-binding protein n=1 Tax=Lyngbya aestuarii TaxID=118322 RepID=UPI00403D9F20